MTKAKLIKRNEVAEQINDKMARMTQKENVQKTMNDVVKWLEGKHVNREDPRKAFAALFVQSQPN